MRVKTLAATLALALVAAAAAAGETRPVSSGDKVRITTDAGRRFSATVVDLQGDTLIVRTGRGAATTRLPMAGLRRLEVARGWRDHSKEGAIIGFVPGFALGALAGSLLDCLDEGSDCSSVGTGIFTGVITGGITGLAGGLVGMAVRTRRWEDVPGPRPQLGAAIIAVPGGAQARLSLSF